MNDKVQIYLYLIGAVLVIVYLFFGFIRNDQGYMYEGWVFAPVRALNKLLCGMFIFIKF